MEPKYYLWVQANYLQLEEKYFYSSSYFGVAKSFGRTLKARKKESVPIESHIKIALHKHKNIDDFKYTSIITMFFRDKKNQEKA